MHYIISLLIKLLLKVVYLWSEVEKKVKFFRIISILGLLTHMMSAKNGGVQAPTPPLVRLSLDSLMVNKQANT